MLNRAWEVAWKYTLKGQDYVFQLELSDRLATVYLPVHLTRFERLDPLDTHS